MSLTPGTKLGPYEILVPVGSGGMGQVYRAHDPRLNRDVAIKVSSARFSDRFEREAQAIAALNHPHICQVYDVGPNYLVMELIDGSPLGGPLIVEKALSYAVQICLALEAAHSKQIVHRDLKPANILLTASGVKLLDFGLARVAAAAGPEDATRTMSLTEVGSVIGTAAYMSPEQARGDTVDTRSDIFSFGVVLYELLSGKRAFAGKSAADTISAVLRDEPAPLDLPPNVFVIIGRCMRKLPEDRYQTISEVRTEIEGLVATTAIERQVPEKLPSIAVLPFINLSADKENEYFSDGLAEEILNLLARIKGLKVIARTSSFAFRGKSDDIAKIAETLRVQHVLEGSVRRAGNRIRVTAQLVQVSDGSHIWSERFDRDFAGVFAIQDEIGQAIADALQVRLISRGRAINLRAWECWLRGVHFRQSNTPQFAAKAQEQFELAIAIDPDYAQAYSGLALCYYVLANMGARPLSEMKHLAKHAAEKALALDPTDSDAHTVLGGMAGIFDYDWEVARGHHLKAIAGDTVSPRARYVYAFSWLVPTGNTAEAVEQSRLALQTDPLAMLYHSGLIYSLFAAGRHTEAIDAARQAIEMAPDSHLILLTMGFAQLGAGQPSDAVMSFTRCLQVAPWYVSVLGCLAAAHHLAGNPAAARELARQFTGPSSFGAAIYYAAAGQIDAMFEALEEAFARRDLYLPSLRSISLFDRYHDDPRFQRLRQRLNFA